MKKLVSVPLLFLLCAACRPGANRLIKAMMADEQSSIVQHKIINGVSVQMMYMPLYWHKMELQSAPGQEADTSEMDFRLTVRLPNGHAAVADPVLSYGIDSLFALVLDADTIMPVYTHKISNGNLGGDLYLLGFERMPLTNVAQAELVFNDRLFTNNRIMFPLDIQQIAKIDSLSTRL